MAPQDEEVEVDDERPIGDYEDPIGNGEAPRHPIVKGVNCVWVFFWYRIFTGPIIFVIAITVVEVGVLVVYTGATNSIDLRGQDWLATVEARPCQALELVANKAGELEDQSSIEITCTYMLPQASTWGSSNDYASASASYLDETPQLVAWKEELWYEHQSNSRHPKSVAEVGKLIGFKPGDIFASDSQCYYLPDLVNYGLKPSSFNSSASFNRSVASAIPTDHPVFAKLPVGLAELRTFQTIAFFVFVAAWTLSLIIVLMGFVCDLWTYEGYDHQESSLHIVMKCSLALCFITAMISAGLLVSVAFSGIDKVSLNQRVRLPQGISSNLWSARWDTKKQGGYYGP